MKESEKQIENLQLRINLVNCGYCFAFKLVNYEELNAITTSDAKGIEILDTIIQEVCNELIATNKSNKYFKNISDRTIDSYLQIFTSKQKVKKDDNNSFIYKQVEENRIFLILPIEDKNFAREFALKIYSISQLYIDNNNPEFYLNCSIASIEFPKFAKNAKDISNLLNWLLSCNSDQLYYREYDHKQYNIENIKESNRQLNSLRRAILQKTMIFAYQPVIDRKTMKAHYYECLLRIPDTKNNLISAGTLIQEAEKKGLIFIIDKIVLEMAIKELAANHNLKLAVNISNIGVLDYSLLELAEKLLEEYDVYGRLIIEITETTFNQNYEQISDFMLKLRKFGCKFALDDFGTGFTSFKQLQNLPIDIIKIPGDYVRNITNDTECKDFIARLIKISESLGAVIVAEFVENGEIAQCLIDLKVDGMQGDFFSPALIIK
ncbi:MAG: EAL domain-containing protein [Rickettsia endosymbiont of Bryobia graminum]|nr:EAL domain-containing protein [Rickettsia endosymbiont of Bryobia graminum]